MHKSLDVTADTIMIMTKSTVAASSLQVRDAYHPSEP